MEDFPAHLALNQDILACPACSAGLRFSRTEVTCTGEGHRFPVSNGIPQLFLPNEWDPAKKDVTDTVKAFYEKTPFPNYDDFDSPASLMEKARKGKFAWQLNREIPFGARVLEVGCGTGQLSNFLGLATRRVVGVDMCLNSLSLGEKFRAQHELWRVNFFQMNLFRPIFRPASFDVVTCLGVLHHTSDPLGGFRSIARLVKPGGIILIGLYHRYGRLITDARRVLFRWFGEGLHFLDPYLRQTRNRGAKHRAWLADQYQHPHESKHTIGEVMKWFANEGLDFVNCVPSPRLFAPLADENTLFRTVRAPSLTDRIGAESAMILTGSREGGFFTMIGRRRGEAVADETKLAEAA